MTNYTLIAYQKSTSDTDYDYEHNAESDQNIVFTTDENLITKHYAMYTHKNRMLDNMCRAEYKLTLLIDGTLSEDAVFRKIVIAANAYLNSFDSEDAKCKAFIYL